MLRRTDITRALAVQPIRSERAARRRYGATESRYVVCVHRPGPGLGWPVAFALAAAVAVGTALAHVPSFAAERAAARGFAGGATAPSGAACATAPSSDANAATATGDAVAPAAAISDEPERFVLTTRAGALPSQVGPVAREGIGLRTAAGAKRRSASRADVAPEPRVERTFEVAVALGPKSADGGSEALVEFGRVTGRVSDPRAGEFVVSSRLPLPLDPARRRLAAWITAPGSSEIALRLDADGRIVEIGGLDVVERRAAERARDERLRPVVAAALDEATIRSLLASVVARPSPADDAAAPDDLAAAETSRARDPAVLRVGAWPSELE